MNPTLSKMHEDAREHAIKALKAAWGPSYDPGTHVIVTNTIAAEIVKAESRGYQKRVKEEIQNSLKFYVVFHTVGIMLMYVNEKEFPITMALEYIDDHHQNSVLTGWRELSLRQFKAVYIRAGHPWSKVAEKLDQLNAAGAPGGIHPLFGTKDRGSEEAEDGQKG